MSKNYTGLYYPFIHFKDDNWLKLAALYWDKMGRIVPAEYGKPSDSDTVTQLRDGLDFIENLEPGSEAVTLGDKFVKLLQTHGDKLRDHYNVSQSDKWPVDQITKDRAPEGTNSRFAYIFHEKLSDDLESALEQTQLALPGQGRDPRWIGMHPKLASVYMAALADEIARNRGFQPVTDERRNHLAVAGCTLERLTQALLGDVKIDASERMEKEVEEQMVRLAFQTVIPEDIAGVPVKNIIKVRKEHVGELTNFQEYVHKLVADLEELENIQDRDQFEQRLEMAFNKNIRPKLEELQKTLKSANIRSTLSAMSVSMSLPPLVTAVAGLAGLAAPTGLVAMIPGAALGLTTVWIDRKKSVTEAMNKSPVAYLVRLEKDLAPANLVSWIIHDAKEFMFGP